MPARVMVAIHLLMTAPHEKVVPAVQTHLTLDTWDAARTTACPVQVLRMSSAGDSRAVQKDKWRKVFVSYLTKCC